MADTTIAKLVIKLIGQTADVKRELNDVKTAVSRFSTESGNAFATLRKSWIALSAAVIGTAYALRKAWNLADFAAEIQEQIDSVESLGRAYGVSAQIIIKNVKEAARGLISEAEAAKIAARALLLGFSPDQLYKYIGVLEQLTDVLGGDIAQAFDVVATAAATGRTMTLANYGVTVKVEELYVRYAKTLNKNADALTENERKTARLVGILQEFEKIIAPLGKAVDSTKDKMDRMKKSADDVRLAIGQFIPKAFMGATALFYQLAAAATTAAAGLFRIYQAYEWIGSKIGVTAKIREEHRKNTEEAKQNAEAAINSAVDLVEKSNKYLDVFVAGMEGAGKKTSQLVLPLEEVADTSKDTGKALQSLKDKAAELGTQTLALTDPIAASKEEFERWIETTLRGIARTAEINVAIAKLRASYNDFIKTQQELAIIEAKRKDESQILAELSKTESALLESSYKQSKIAVTAYYNEKKRLASDALDIDIEELGRQYDLAAMPEKRIEVETEMNKRLIEYGRQRIEINDEEIDANKKLAQNQIDIQNTILAARKRGLSDTLQIYKLEELEMQNRHDAEIKALQEKNAAIQEIEDLRRAHELEKEKLLSDQKRELYLKNAELMSNTFAEVSGAFDKLYSITGSRIKAFFYLSKAAALAEAIVNVAQAYTKALAQGGALFGIPLAQIVLAAGMTQIATIMATTIKGYATGGQIGGKAGKDTNLIAVTRGEYIQPVPTVRYYGEGVMEAIRKRAIPRSLLAPFSLYPALRPSLTFAEGGTVTGIGYNGTKAEKKEMNFFNIIDPREIDTYMASARGGDAIVNVISSRANKIRKIILR